MTKFKESIIVVLITLIFLGLYAKKQPQLTVRDGKGWDGVAYHAMYKHYKNIKDEVTYKAPFNKRVGLPWLAAQLPLEETQAFLLINLACGLLTILFAYLTICGEVGGVALFACLVPLLCYVFSPIRWPNYYPYTVDPPAMMLYSLTAYLLTKKHFSQP